MLPALEVAPLCDPYAGKEAKDIGLRDTARRHLTRIEETTFTRYETAINALPGEIPAGSVFPAWSRSITAVARLGTLQQHVD